MPDPCTCRRQTVDRQEGFQQHKMFKGRSLPTSISINDTAGLKRVANKVRIHKSTMYHLQHMWHVLTLNIKVQPKPIVKEEMHRFNTDVHI